MTIKQYGGVFGRNPTFNDVTIEGELTFDGDIDINSDLKIDGNLEVTGTSSLTGNTSISRPDNGVVDFNATNTGTTGTSNSRIRAYVSGATGGDPSIGVGITGVQDYYWSIDNSDSDKLKLLANGSPILDFTPAGAATFSDNVIIGTSGKGIDFSATSGTGTSELFDDYEEGTWTPAFSGGDYTFTYNKQKGSYTKIGNRVYVDMVLYVHPSTAPSGTVDGNLSVTGLPYAFNKQNDVESVGGIVTFKQLFLSATETVATRLSDTGTSFLLYSTLATNYPDSGFVQASSVGANARIRIQFSYPTNG